MLGEDLRDVVEALVEKVLLMVMRHPLRQDRASAAHDSRNALGDERQVLDKDAGVNRHVIDALLRLLLDHFQHDVGVQIFNALDARDRLVNGHRSNRHARVPQDGFTDLVNVAPGRKVHHGVSAVMNRGVQLAQFLLDIAGDGRVTDVGVDLALRLDADAHGLDFRMIHVGRDDHASGGNFVAHQLRRDLLALRNVQHLLGQQAFAGKMHLRQVGVAGACSFLTALGDPIGTRIHCGCDVSLAIAAVLAVVCAHKVRKSPAVFDIIPPTVVTPWKPKVKASTRNSARNVATFSRNSPSNLR